MLYYKSNRNHEKVIMCLRPDPNGTNDVLVEYKSKLENGDQFENSLILDNPLRFFQFVDEDFVVCSLKEATEYFYQDQ